jgi:hypothetical protein
LSPSPRYAANYEPSFHVDVRELGFSAKNFDALFRRSEFEICDNPWLSYSGEVPESEGMRILPTRAASRTSRRSTFITASTARRGKSTSSA